MENIKYFYDEVLSFLEKQKTAKNSVDEYSGCILIDDFICTRTNELEYRIINKLMNLPKDSWDGYAHMIVRTLDLMHSRIHACQDSYIIDFPEDHTDCEYFDIDSNNITVYGIPGVCVDIVVHDDVITGKRYDISSLMSDIYTFIYSLYDNFLIFDIDLKNIAKIEGCSRIHYENLLENMSPGGIGWRSSSPILNTVTTVTQTEKAPNLINDDNFIRNIDSDFETHNLKYEKLFTPVISKSKFTSTMTQAQLGTMFRIMRDKGIFAASDSELYNFIASITGGNACAIKKAAFGKKASNNSALANTEQADEIVDLLQQVIEALRKIK